MPRRPTSITKSAEQAGTTEPVKAAETIVATLTGVSPDDQTPRIWIEGSCDVVGGTTATTAVVRVRRNGLTGPVVTAALTGPVVAAASAPVAISAFDQIEGEQAGLSYVLTIEQPAATTNPKVTGAVISATY